MCVITFFFNHQTKVERPNTSLSLKFRASSLTHIKVVPLASMFASGCGKSDTKLENGATHSQIRLMRPIWKMCVASRHASRTWFSLNRCQTCSDRSLWLAGPKVVRFLCTCDVSRLAEPSRAVASRYCAVLLWGKQDSRPSPGRHWKLPQGECVPCVSQDRTGSRKPSRAGPQQSFPCGTRFSLCPVQFKPSNWGRHRLESPWRRGWSWKWERWSQIRWEKWKCGPDRLRTVCAVAHLIVFG